MMEYIFFDEGLKDKFLHFLQAKGVACETGDDEMGLVVAVPEDLGDAIAEAAEDYYEELMQEQANLLEETEDRLEKNAAGVNITLSDGQPCMVRIAPELLAKVLGCISIEELHALVVSVARSVENPDNRPLCKTV